MAKSSSSMKSRERPRHGSGDPAAPDKARVPTPTEYSERLRRIELVTVALERLDARVNWAREPKTEGAVPLALHQGYATLPYQTDGQVQPVACDFEFVSKTSNRVFLKIVVRYRLAFRSPEPFDEPFFEIFQSMSAPGIAWPYLRELASGLMARMGLPPLTLPLRVTLPVAPQPAQEAPAAAGRTPSKAKRAKRKQAPAL
jgi:hypothetical protein